MNPLGTPANLVASHPGNRNAERHGVYAVGSPAVEGRAAEVADAIRALPHVEALDEVAAIEIGRLVALIERMDVELARGCTSRRGEAKTLLKLRLGASRRLQEWLSAFAMTPRSRAAFVRESASGSLATEIARRRAGKGS